MLVGFLNAVTKCDYRKCGEIYPTDISRADTKYPFIGTEFVVVHKIILFAVIFRWKIRSDY